MVKPVPERSSTPAPLDPENPTTIAWGTTGAFTYRAWLSVPTRKVRDTFQPPSVSSLLRNVPLSLMSPSVRVSIATVVPPKNSCPCRSIGPAFTLMIARFASMKSVLMSSLPRPIGLTPWNGVNCVPDFVKLPKFVATFTGSKGMTPGVGRFDEKSGTGRALLVMPSPCMHTPTVTMESGGSSTSGSRT